MNRRSFLARLGGTFAALATGAVGFEKLVAEAIPSDALVGTYTPTVLAELEDLVRQAFRAGFEKRYICGAQS